MSGHAFIRPGRPTPDAEPVDACVRCGEPEPAHRAETAEVIAARAILADFQTDMHEFTTGTRPDVDFVTWSLRLAQHMQQLINAVAGER